MKDAAPDPLEVPRLRARKVPWFEERLEAWLYIGCIAAFYEGIAGSIVAGNRGADSLATFLLVMAAISTWWPGALAQERSGWDFMFRRFRAMTRFQIWLQTGLALPSAIRAARGPRASQ